MCAERVREDNRFETCFFCRQSELSVSILTNGYLHHVRTRIILMERPHCGNSNMQGSAPGCLSSLQQLGISDANLSYHPEQ